MSLPFAVPDARFRKDKATPDGDEGVRFSTPESLGALGPVLEGGTVTFGGRTHPADGNAALIVATPDRTRQRGPGYPVGLKSGWRRSRKASIPSRAAAVQALAPKAA